MKNTLIMLAMFTWFSTPAQAQPEVEACRLSSLKGAPTTLSASPGERVAVLFWGSWCPICKEKMKTVLPDIASKGMAKVVTVNMDKTLERAEKSVEKEKITFPVTIDKEKCLSGPLGVFGVPHWAVFKAGANGKLELVATHAGFDDSDFLAALKR